MRGPPRLADCLHALEQFRIHWCREPRRLLLLIWLALVPDGSARVERVGQRLGQARLGHPELVSQFHVAPHARRVHAIRAPDKIEDRSLDRLQELALPHSLEA